MYVVTKEMRKKDLRYKGFRDKSEGHKEMRRKDLRYKGFRDISEWTRGKERKLCGYQKRSEGKDDWSALPWLFHKDISAKINKINERESESEVIVILSVWWHMK